MKNETRPHIKPGAIKYTKGFGVKLFMSKLIRLIIITLIVTAIVGTFYIYIKGPIKTVDGYSHANIVHRMYIVGEEVLVVDDKSHNMFTPLKRALITQQPKAMTVIAGPYGEIKEASEKGKYKAVYGSDTYRVNLDIDQDRYLDEEYIVRLTSESGNYESSNRDLIVTKEEIVGIIGDINEVSNEDMPPLNTDIIETQDDIDERYNKKKKKPLKEEGPKFKDSKLNIIPDSF